jgi:hypothetical protein
MKITVLLVALTGISSAAVASSEGPVWYWFAACGGPTMKLEVRLDDKLIFASSFPLCRTLRDGSGSEGKSKKLEYSFAPNRALIWSGYKDEPEVSPAGQAIEGDIWLAGADPSVAILGVSFRTPFSNLMNTLHLAYPNKPSRSEVAPGLVIVTTPTVFK